MSDIYTIYVDGPNLSISQAEKVISSSIICINNLDINCSRSMVADLIRMRRENSVMRFVMPPPLIDSFNVERVREEDRRSFGK